SLVRGMDLWRQPTYGLCNINGPATLTTSRPRPRRNSSMTEQTVDPPAGRGKRVNIERGIYQYERQLDRYLIMWSVDAIERTKIVRGSLAQARKERERLLVKTREGEILAPSRLKLSAVWTTYV